MSPAVVTGNKIIPEVKNKMQTRLLSLSVAIAMAAAAHSGLQTTAQAAPAAPGAAGKPFQDLQSQIDALCALVNEKCPDDPTGPNPSPTFDSVTVRTEVNFGDGSCSIGIVPGLTGLVETDPGGFRLLGFGETGGGGRLAFGATEFCTISADPAGLTGLRLSDPAGVRLINPFPNRPTQVVFGPTDDCGIGIFPDLPGLTEFDPVGFRLLGPGGQGCRLIFGPTMDCTIEVALDGPPGLLLRDPRGIRILNPEPGLPPSLFFGPTDDCGIRAGTDATNLRGLIVTDPFAVMVDSPNLIVEGNVIAQEFVSRSSRSLKENIRPIENALDKIIRLQGVSFEWKSGQGHAELGLIAEDVAEVLPELVVTKDDGQSVEGVKYPNLVAVAVEGIKQQQHQIQSLRDENDALKKALSALQDQIGAMATRIETLGIQTP
jgi:hypothetical protein